MAPSLPLPSAPPASPASPPTADLMIRQEDLRLEPDDAGTIVVRDRQFLGREYRYCLTTPSGQTLYARTAVGQPLAIDTCVNVSVDEAALQIFPAKPASSP